MRVALVCDWFLRYVVPLSVALRRAGADVVVLCCDHAAEFGGSRQERASLLAEARSAEVGVLELPGRLRSLRGLPRTAAVRRELARWEPDVVHAQLNGDFRLLAASRGLPTVLTIHEPAHFPGSFREPWYRRLVRAAWGRCANRIIVHGEAMRQELATKVDGARIAVVRHGTAPHAAPFACPDEPRVVLFGRLEPYKGLPVLLEAMDLVWQARPETRLAVVGRGRAAAELPPDDRIERDLRYVPESEVDGVFRRASLVVLPYLSASQSGVGLLAIARGIPTVVTAVGALAELAVDPSLVVPPRDPGALAAAILRHLDHGSELRERVLEHARRTFSWDVVATQSLAVYRDAVADWKAPA